MNYTYQSIAHNLVTVTDPADEPEQKHGGQSHEQGPPQPAPQGSSHRRALQRAPLIRSASARMDRMASAAGRPSRLNPPASSML